MGKNPKNQAPVAQFWACCVKRRRRMMLGRGGCELMTQRQRGGCTFTNAKPGSGGWAKIPKTERLWLSFGRAM